MPSAKDTVCSLYIQRCIATFARWDLRADRAVQFYLAFQGKAASPRGLVPRSNDTLRQQCSSRWTNNLVQYKEDLPITFIIACSWSTTLCLCLKIVVGKHYLKRGILQSLTPGSACLLYTDAVYRFSVPSYILLIRKYN